MSGYYTSTSTLANEDWLISPAFNADLLQDEVLSFWLANNYIGTDLQLFYATDYSGMGNPNSTNWNEITNFNIQNVSSGDFNWVSSGDIDLSYISGTNVHIAFKFSCNDGESKLWEIDDIILNAVNPNSILELKNSSISSVNIYPNPTSGQINISYRITKTTDLELEIFDITGTKAYSYRANNQASGEYTINLNTSKLDLRSGLYMIKVNNKLKKLIIK